MAPRRVLDRRAVASGARWVQLCRHPDGQAVGVCWAFTQEEPVCWAHPAGGRIQLRVPDVAGVLQDIHPGGREYLASTEWDEDAVAAGAPEALERRHYPDGALLERLAIAGMPRWQRGAVDARAGVKRCRRPPAFLRLRWQQRRSPRIVSSCD